MEAVPKILTGTKITVPSRHSAKGGTSNLAENSTWGYCSASAKFYVKYAGGTKDLQR